MFELDLGFALAFSLPIDKNKYIRKRPPFSFSDSKYIFKILNYFQRLEAWVVSWVGVRRSLTELDHLSAIILDFSYLHVYLPDNEKYPIIWQIEKCMMMCAIVIMNVCLTDILLRLLYWF